MTPSLTVAVPTFNNPDLLRHSLLSLVRNSDFVGNLLVVNNGDGGEDLYNAIQSAIPHDIRWIDAGSNLGWEGGINLALRHADSDYFCMMNDDVLFPPQSNLFWSQQLSWFQFNNVGGVGPTSNYVAGAQSAYIHGLHPTLRSPYLIGMCATYRTSLLRSLDGLDEGLPGGDDLDLAIRIKDAGYYLVADRRCYLHHTGSVTGRRIHEDYWDSPAHQANTYNALIRKHGLRKWYDLVNTAPAPLHFAGARAVQVDLMHHLEMFGSQGHEIRLRYLKACITPSDVDQHLPVLYRYAAGCSHVTEFGTNDGTTSLAFLYAQPATFDTYDINRHPEVSDLERLAKGAGIRFTFHNYSTLSKPIARTDFLFIDDLHTYEHVRRELEMHAGSVSKYIFFHDTVLCEAKDEGEENGPGVWPAIAHFLRDHPEWRICHVSDECNGLIGIMKVY